MPLNNPLFRQLLRCIVAGFLEQAKDAYKKLIFKFGDNIEAAAKFMWENRDKDPFKLIGGEEIARQTVKDMYEIVAKDELETVTLPKIFAFMSTLTRQQSGPIPPDLPASRFVALKNTFRNFPPKMEHKLITQFKNKVITEQELYDILNIARNQLKYEKAYHDQNIFQKSEKRPGATQVTPASPMDIVYNKYASTSVGTGRLEVVLKYIDSLNEGR